MKKIRPTDKVQNKQSIWNNRTWAEALDMSIGTGLTTWNWQCGINALTPANDFHRPQYYMWYWKDDRLFRDLIPMSLNDYIEALCKKRNFVP